MAGFNGPPIPAVTAGQTGQQLGHGQRIGPQDGDGSPGFPPTEAERGELSIRRMRRSYSASVKGIKSLLYSIMRCPDLSLFRVFHDVAHLVRLRFARS